ncbi:MAG: Tex family protein [Candidatus Auribacterota bacterium]|jgi:uncharacterized protein|nr:Tex family protein [Candidatus Auribacterota bacterium]
MDITTQISRDIGISGSSVAKTLSLLDSGATVPFIARYRKEMTGNLDETLIRTIQEKQKYYIEIQERKNTIIASIEEQGKLTPQLKEKIEATLSKTELEDIYLPFKPKRKTRASIAKDKGLEPLADIFLEKQNLKGSLDTIAQPFINDQVPTVQSAVQGAEDIIAERISEDASLRKILRALLWRQSKICSKAKKDFIAQKTKFEMYYDFEEPVRSIPSHRSLAMFRGENEGVLQLTIDAPENACLSEIRIRYMRNPSGFFTDIINDAITDGLRRLLLPSLTNEIRAEMKDKADLFAIETFAKNLRQLLLASPLGAKPVLALDPGFRTGIKTVALNDTGKLVHNTVIYPLEPHNKIDQAEVIIKKLVDQYDVKHIAVGNGTASRETESFLLQCKEKFCLSCEIVVVNESGASVYSVSDCAREEFPDLDATVRGAVSIGRRLQDPLAELVKIDPKSLGVGQYQHDVNQKLLKQKLDDEVEHCVNLVGVDLNTSSEALLSYTAGIGKTLARNIIKYRNEHGSFDRKQDLLNVTKFGQKAFEQAAGFLRIRGGDNPLDASGIHPESYGIVEKILADLTISIDELIGNERLINSIDIKRYTSNTAGTETVADIISELRKPGHDPRPPYEPLNFNENIRTLDDIREGMILPGVVTNVAHFGAFVDVGVHQDGLIHISQLSDNYVSDPNDIVKVGDRVSVKVVSVDRERKRLSLSMKDMYINT